MTKPKISQEMAKSSLNQKIGQTLFLLRKAFGETQSDVARVIGVTAQQYQKYECGRSPTPITSLILVCEYYDTPITVLLEEFEHRPPERDEVLRALRKRWAKKMSPTSSFSPPQNQSDKSQTEPEDT